MSIARGILNGDDLEAQGHLLLGLLSDAAAGRDLFGVATEVIQAVIAGGTGSVYIKRLAYDLCKLVPLTDADYEFLIVGLKNDINAVNPDIQAVALQYLPNLPGAHLCSFVDRGDVRTFLEPCLKSGSPDVRGAALSAIAQLLIHQDLLAVACNSQGLRGSFQDWWEMVADGLVDTSPTVVAATLGAVNLLLTQSARKGTEKAGCPETILVTQFAQHVQAAVLSGLPAVLHAMKEVPQGVQVDVASLLAFLGQHIIATQGSDASLASLSQQLIQLCSSINPAARMEAAKGLLGFCSAIRARGLQGPGFAPAPPSWSNSAMTALLGLKERQYVEVALDDIIITVAEHLGELQAGARAGVVKKLLPLVSGLPGMQARIQALALLWNALLELHMETLEARSRGENSSWGTSLSGFLDDPAVRDMIEGIQGPVLPLPQIPESPLTDPGSGRSEFKKVVSMDIFRSPGSAFSSALSSPASTPAHQEARPPPLPPTFKQEVACSLLCVLTYHPAAVAASTLSPLVQEEGPAAPIREVAWREQQAAALHWMAGATAALEATQVVMLWEPYMPPTSAFEASSAAPPSQQLLVNFTSVPPDAWLKLLGRCSHAVRAVLRTLGYSSMSGLLRANQQRMLERLNAADNGSQAMILQQTVVSLQTYIKKVLETWDSLALSVRPRLLWVAAASLELPPLLDEAWTHLLKACESLLLTSGSAVPETHLRDLAIATMSGCLYPNIVDQQGLLQNAKATGAALLNSVRNALPPGLPFGSSALPAETLGGSVMAELAETSADGQQVGLQVLQHLIWLLDDALHSEEVKKGQVQPPAAVLVNKLRTLTKRLAVQPAATPDIRNTCRRLLKSLSNFEAFEQQQAFAASLHQELQLQDQDTDDDTPRTPQNNNPLAPGANGANATNGAANGSGNGAVALQSAVEGMAVGSILTTSSATLQRPWGYPFSAPRSSVLCGSGRHKRHTAMEQMLDAAVQRAAWAEEKGAATATELGPMLSATGGMRLDDPAFWKQVEGGGSCVEVSGPSDPIIITSSYSLHPDDPTNLQITLKAFNRLDIEVEGVEIQVRLVGAMLTERRGASWHVPKLLPLEATRHQFVLKMMGFSQMEVHCKVLLPLGQVGEFAPPVLNCQPFPIPLSALLHRPSPAPTQHTFFSNWQTLPLSAHLSALCTWAGVEGMLLCLSAFQSMPLERVWLRTVPALSSCQAAYTTLTASEEVVAMVVTMQLMPADDGTLAGSITSARAAVEITVRSTSHEVISTIQMHPSQWLTDIAEGCLTYGLRTPPTRPASTKPSLHPDIAPLQQLYQRSSSLQLQKLATSINDMATHLRRMTVEDPNNLAPSTELEHDDVAQGNWVRSTAMAEWRRLCAAV